MQGLHTRLMPASPFVLTSPNQVLEKILTSSMILLVINQLIHQESGTDNLQHFNSNNVPLLPIIFLCFHISWGDLLMMLLIMKVLGFALQLIYWNLPLNLFHIYIPFRSNQFIMVKWNSFSSSFTQGMMMVFWMLTSKCFRIY